MNLLQYDDTEAETTEGTVAMDFTLAATNQDSVYRDLFIHGYAQAPWYRYVYRCTSILYSSSSRTPLESDKLYGLADRYNPQELTCLS